MSTQVLTRARDELFRRAPDESFPDLATLSAHCRAERDESRDRWHPPGLLAPSGVGDRLEFALGSEGSFAPNDWSFGQLCGLARVSRDTVNRLAPATAAQVFRETIPGGNKPLQLYTRGNTVRSVHAASYTRLHNADLVQVVQEFPDFTPPQKAAAGGTGLYCGEQDMFCFLIDPTGWAEIEDQVFAPGFFVWNSEVGKRSVGIQAFWFQAVCANHIVWDAAEVVEFTRKHTASVGESLVEIRRIIEGLAKKRDERRDGFVTAIRKAMGTSLGADAEEALRSLTKHGIPKGLAKEALAIAEKQGRFTVFALVDALTRISQQFLYTADRLETDLKVAQLLELSLAA